MSKSDKLVIGILAHVDAGKTTLSEAFLYKNNVIRNAGRVDKGNTYMDSDEMERRRGITIFSNEARFTRKIGDSERTYILLDTPGHTDFSPEMERTLNVLDYAILVISAPDGVTGQVRMLWKLIKHYKIPAFIFVNKMDQDGTDAASSLEHLKHELGSECINFSDDVFSDKLQEELAVCDDTLLASYLEGSRVSEDNIRKLISEGRAFPVYFGSALKMEGVDELLEGLDRWTLEKQYGADFGCRVYKITHDNSSLRLTWIKLTGGSLKAKSVIEELTDENGKPEKADQLRIYYGDKFTSVPEIFPGDIAAVTGLTATYAGQGLGFENSREESLLQPIMTARLILPEKEDPFRAYRSLLTLSEEEPSLNILYDEESRELTAQVMGVVQKEILQELIFKRFNLKVGFGATRIIYKETIANTVEGVGHFEPLRHYAEVHLLLEPTERGSGLTFASDCSTDILALNWQRLVLTHLEERRHRGVLTGSEITDMKISIIAGRAHEKHTEGGDFRQATYRAVRQGLMMAESILLEPYLDFSLDIPSENLGRVLNDLDRMGADFLPPDIDGDTAFINGSAPAASLSDYPEKLSELSKGQGHITCSLKGYERCHNPEEVIASFNYDPELDMRNPSSSVFCSHGSGTIIPWYEVRDYMQVESPWKPSEKEEAAPMVKRPAPRSMNVSEEELIAIFERTYGPIKDRSQNNTAKKTYSYSPPAKKPHKGKPRPDKEYLLVDGYNIIYSWEDLKKLSEDDIKAGRDKLMDILSNYAGISKERIILVFDAYKVPGGTERIYKYHNIDVVFTAEAQTADLYIERTAHELQKNYGVTVATSDAVEQVIIYGSGALRLSARDLLERVINTEREIQSEYLETQRSDRNYMGEVIPQDIWDKLEE